MASEVHNTVDFRLGLTKASSPHISQKSKNGFPVFLTKSLDTCTSIGLLFCMLILHSEPIVLFNFYIFNTYRR